MAKEARSGGHRLGRRIALAVAALAAFLGVVVALQILSGGDGFSLIDEATGEWAYLAVFLLVVGHRVELHVDNLLDVVVLERQPQGGTRGRRADRFGWHHLKPRPMVDGGSTER